MFNLFKKKDPSAKLRKEYQRLMEEAMLLQRTGDIKGYAQKVDEAEKISERIGQMVNS